MFLAICYKKLERIPASCKFRTENKTLYLYQRCLHVYQAEADLSSPDFHQSDDALLERAGTQIHSTCAGIKPHPYMIVDKSHPFKFTDYVRKLYTITFKELAAGGSVEKTVSLRLSQYLCHTHTVPDIPHDCLQL